jgi:hypothetical protein
VFAEGGDESGASTVVNLIDEEFDGIAPFP